VEAWAIVSTRSTRFPIELAAIVREFHHVQEEHRRARPESRVRRHLHSRLEELEERFERLLEEWVADEETRAAWRAHLYQGAPRPAESAPERPLTFRGRSEAGSVVEIRKRPDGSYDVEVDGALVERIEGGLDFAGGTAPPVFRLDGSEFRETFSASPAALEALRDSLAGDAAHPPWDQAAELVADGLVDRDFGLTERGRRALAAAARRFAWSS
jgi:hypothetical protein